MRYLLLPDSQAVPGFHPVPGPDPTGHGGAGILFERTPCRPYVRVIPAAAKLPEDQVVPTVIDPRFPLNEVVLLPDTASVSPGADPERGAQTRPRCGAP